MVQILIKNRLNANKIDKIHFFKFIIYKIRTKINFEKYNLEVTKKRSRFLIEFLYRFRNIKNYFIA
jgi:hypothetical protein